MNLLRKKNPFHGYDMAFLCYNVRREHLTILKLNYNLKTSIVIVIWSRSFSNRVIFLDFRRSYIEIIAVF